MLVGETVAVAFQSIRANKLRAGLTMLGIIIGVGAVITMVALGSGAQKAIEDRISALGANILTIFPGQGFRGGIAFNDRTAITTDDYEALRRDARLLKAVSHPGEDLLRLRLHAILKQRSPEGSHSIDPRSIDIHQIPLMCGCVGIADERRQHQRAAGITRGKDVARNHQHFRERPVAAAAKNRDLRDADQGIPGVRLLGPVQEGFRAGQRNRWIVLQIVRQLRSPQDRR